MKKFLFFAVVFTMAMVIMPNVYAHATYGAVEVLTGTGDVLDNETENVTVSIDGVDLKWYEANPAIGIYDDGWGIGINFLAPDSLAADTATLKVLGGEAIKFTEVEDLKPPKPTRYFRAWISIDQTLLDSKEDVFELCTYEFDWDGNGQYEQKVTVKVNPQTIKFQTPEGVILFTVKGANGSRVFTIKGGNKLSDLNEEDKALLDEVIKAPEGKQFVGYKKKNGEMLIDDEEISDGEVLEAQYEEVKTSVVGSKDSNSSIDNPNTSDKIITIVLTLILASGCELLYAIRKIMSN